MWQRFREWSRPIADDSLPLLRSHMQSAAAALSPALTVMAGAYPILEWIAGRGGVARLVAGLPTLSICGLVWLASRRSAGRRHPQAQLFLIAVACIIGVELHAAVDEGYSDLTAMIAVVPIIVAAFVPWRPTLSLLLLIPAPLLVVGRHVIWGDPSSTAPFGQQLFIVVCLGGLAAIANQVQRGVWLKLETTRTRANLLTVDRMASLGRLTAGIAHELKTPVAAALHGAQSARSLVEELHQSVGHPDVEEADLRAIAAELDQAVVGIRGDVERCARFVNAIRDQTRSMSAADHVEVRVAERVDSVRALLGHRLRKSPIALEVDVDPEIAVHGDPGKLDQVLTNLITNALDACEAHPAASVVRVTAQRRSGGTLIGVSDDGPGVPVALRERIFEVLFTTRGEGTGLGLAICRDIAEGAFGGTLELVASESGARFELYCPAGGVAPSSAAVWQPHVHTAPRPSERPRPAMGR